ncbi:MAG: hypothetical protein MUF80_00285 [Burkholderiales bacterium]|nr:hypothetical protein [Burkholderiales bacterium]
MNQADSSETATVDLAEGGVHLLIARPSASVEVELVSEAEFGVLDALAHEGTLGAAFERAHDQDTSFDAGQFLRRRVVARTLVDFSH